jgi:hypothetical protein
MVTDNSELMQFAIKGTDADWDKALQDQEIGSTGVVQVKSKDKGSGYNKRKLNQEDIDKEAGLSPKTPKGSSKKKKKNRKSRG